MVTDEPEPDFEDLAAAALDNANIDMGDRLRAARVAAEAPAQNVVADVPTQNSPCIIEAQASDKIVYDIIFDLPDAGLIPGAILPNFDATPTEDPAPAPPTGPTTMVPDDNSDDNPRRYPARSCRSVVGNQPYNTYAPRIQFLQLGEVRAHRVLAAMINETKTTPSKGEQLHATTSIMGEIDDMKHAIDAELTTESEDKMAVCGYLMTQYNLKPGLRKIGER